MIHLEKFEGYDPNHLKTGDYVIFILNNKVAEKHGYNLNDICVITKYDVSDPGLPYLIKNITNTEALGLWATPDQIRKAEDWELSSKKYNL